MPGLTKPQRYAREEGSIIASAIGANSWRRVFYGMRRSLARMCTTLKEACSDRSTICLSTVTLGMSAMSLSISETFSARIPLTVIIHCLGQCSPMTLPRSSTLWKCLRRSSETPQNMTARVSKTATGNGAPMLTIRCGHTGPIEACANARWKGNPLAEVDSSDLREFPRRPSRSGTLPRFKGRVRLIETPSASIERTAETCNRQRHGDEHQSNKPCGLGAQVADCRAFEQDAAHDPDEMGQRKALADPLRPSGHPSERESEPRHQNVRQEEHDRHLHRL